MEVGDDVGRERDRTCGLEIASGNVASVQHGSCSREERVGRVGDVGGEVRNGLVVGFAINKQGSQADALIGVGEEGLVGFED